MRHGGKLWSTAARRHVRLASVVFAAAFIVFGAACTGGSDDGSASDTTIDITDVTFVPVLQSDDLTAGTCLKVPDSFGPDEEKLPTIACNKPHTHEIYAAVTSESDTYPGFEELELEAQIACLGEFETYVGVTAFDSDLFYSWIVPSLRGWNLEEDPDRTILCIAGRPGGGLRQTVKNSSQ